MKYLSIFLIVVVLGCRTPQNITFIKGDVSDKKVDQIELMIHSYYEENLPMNIQIKTKKQFIQCELTKDYEVFKLKGAKLIEVKINNKLYKIKNYNYPYVYVGIVNNQAEIKVTYTYAEPRFID